MEAVVGEVYEVERLPRPYRASTNDLLEADEFKEIVGARVLAKLHVLRVHGNRGAHDETKTAEAAE